MTNVTTARQRVLNWGLVALSLIIGFFGLEFGYRIHLLLKSRQVAYDNFAVYSANFGFYDAELGFNYPPNGRSDLSVFVGGQMRRCLSFVTDAQGNAGKPRMLEGPRRQVFVFGDSMTAYQHEGNTWPSILEDKLNARGDRTEIVNFARTGTGILQMIDSAAAILKRRQRPDLIVIAFITDDLARRRLWLQSTVRPDGSVDVFTSIDPSMSFAPGTYYRTALVNPHATREWCEAQKRYTNVNDAILTEVRDAYQHASLQQAARDGRLVSLTAIDRSYLLNRLTHHDPYGSSLTTPMMMDLADFAADHQFVDAINFLKQSGVPIVLVWLPQYEELASGAHTLTMQTRRLKESLLRLSGFPLINLLEPAIPDARSYFNVPFDAHPSRKGLELYANRLADRLPRSRVTP